MARTNLKFTEQLHMVLNAYAVRTDSRSQIASRGELLVLGLKTFDQAKKDGDIKRISDSISFARTNYGLIHDKNTEQAGGVDISNISDAVFSDFKGTFVFPKKSVAYRYAIVLGLGKQQAIRFNDLPDVEVELENFLRELRGMLS